MIGFCAQQDICSITERLNVGAFCARLNAPSRVYFSFLFLFWLHIGLHFVVSHDSYSSESKSLYTVIKTKRRMCGFCYETRARVFVQFVDNSEKRIWWMYQRDFEVDSHNINIMWIYNFEHRLKAQRLRREFQFWYHGMSIPFLFSREQL